MKCRGCHEKEAVFIPLENPTQNGAKGTSFFCSRDCCERYIFGAPETKLIWTPESAS